MIVAEIATVELVVIVVVFLAANITSQMYGLFSDILKLIQENSAITPFICEKVFEIKQHK